MARTKSTHGRVIGGRRSILNEAVIQREATRLFMKRVKGGVNQLSIQCITLSPQQFATKLSVLFDQVVNQVQAGEALIPLVPDLRGCGGNVIILEEATYISVSTFLDVVAPVLVLDSVCLIAISTLGKEPSNFFTRLIQCPEFSSHVISYVCEKCQRKGISEQCKHNLDAIPHWSSEGRVEKIKRIVGEGENARFMLEAMGVLQSSGSPNVFSAKLVDLIFSQPRKPAEDRPVRFVYCVVDPVAGSDIEDTRTSDFAVITIGGSNTTLLGAEAIPVLRRVDYEARVVEHLRRIRQLPMCSNAVIVLDVESGTGLEAGNIIKLVQDNFKGVVPMCDFFNKDGTKTNETSKKEMVQLAEAMLEMNEIFIHENFVTTHAKPEKLLSDLKDQMKDYTREVSTGTKNGKKHEKFHGKINGKLDDLVTTFLRAIRARKHFAIDPKYAAYRGGYSLIDAEAQQQPRVSSR